MTPRFWLTAIATLTALWAVWPLIPEKYIVNTIITVAATLGVLGTIDIWRRGE